jgi:hypothetical protein
MSAIVANPGFEVDLANWTKNDSNASTTWTRDTSETHDGSAGSSKLVNTNAGEDDYINQPINEIGIGLNPGGLYRVTAWVNCTVFTSGAVENRGLFVVSAQTNAVVLDDLTAATAGWVQKSVVLPMPLTDTGLGIRLYAPQGTTYWDDIELAEANEFVPLGFGPF